MAREGSGFSGLTHLDEAGQARMVDVTAKAETAREARARAVLRMRAETLLAIKAGQLAKGDVLGVARVAGIMAAKRTAELIPLCHPLKLTGIDVRFELDEAASAVMIEARVRTVDKTGVEMEALTAAAVAGLTIYDMAKAVDRGMVLSEISLLEKAGGRSGHWVRPAARGWARTGPDQRSSQDRARRDGPARPRSTSGPAKPR